MSRPPDWSERLHAHLVAASARPFAWGSHDCCRFADGAIEAVTGARMFADIVSRYKTERGAMRRLRSFGFATVVEALASRLAPARWPTRGDIAVIGDPAEPLPALGVAAGREIAALGPTGLAVLPLDRAQLIFRVP